MLSNPNAAERGLRRARERSGIEKITSLGVLALCVWWQEGLDASRDPKLAQSGAKELHALSEYPCVWRTRARIKRSGGSMSLESVAPNPSLERNHYHLLTPQQLDAIDDPSDVEAIFERGRRLRLGDRSPIDDEEGWMSYIDAAQRGHCPALGLCFLFGRGTPKDYKRAFEFSLQASQRGHPVGGIH
jgi:hypothetical protein